MPLRSVLDGLGETVQEIYLACEARFAEGKELVQCGQYDGGIYLLGLSAEMLLKLAIYRLDPAIKLTDLADSCFGSLNGAWRRLFRTRFDGHELLGLAIILESEHTRLFGSYDEDLDREFSLCITRLWENWWISMRYRGKYALRSEANAVLQDVEWLRSNHTQLWR